MINVVDLGDSDDDIQHPAQPLRVRRERTPPAIPPPRIQRFVPNSYQEQGQVRQEWPLPANSLHDNGEPRRAQAPNVFIPTENQGQEEEFEASVTCSLCHEIYRKPIQQLLPCLHRYCEECILNWFNTCRNQDAPRTCPLCRRVCRELCNDIWAQSIVQIYYSQNPAVVQREDCPPWTGPDVFTLRAPPVQRDFARPYPENPIRQFPFQANRPPLLLDLAAQQALEHHRQEMRRIYEDINRLQGQLQRAREGAERTANMARQVEQIVHQIEFNINGPRPAHVPNQAQFPPAHVPNYVYIPPADVHDIRFVNQNRFPREEVQNRYYNIQEPRREPVFQHPGLLHVDVNEVQMNAARLQQNPYIHQQMRAYFEMIHRQEEINPAGQREVNVLPRPPPPPVLPEPQFVPVRRENVQYQGAWEQIEEDVFIMNHGHMARPFINPPRHPPLADPPQNNPPEELIEVDDDPAPQLVANTILHQTNHIQLYPSFVYPAFPAPQFSHNNNFQAFLLHLQQLNGAIQEQQVYPVHNVANFIYGVQQQLQEIINNEEALDHDDDDENETDIDDDGSENDQEIEEENDGGSEMENDRGYEERMNHGGQNSQIENREEVDQNGFHEQALNIDVENQDDEVLINVNNMSFEVLHNNELVGQIQIEDVQEQQETNNQEMDLVENFIMTPRSVGNEEQHLGENEIEEGNLGEDQENGEDPQAPEENQEHPQEAQLNDIEIQNVVVLSRLSHNHPHINMQQSSNNLEHHYSRKTSQDVPNSVAQSIQVPERREGGPIEHDRGYLRARRRIQFSAARSRSESSITALSRIISKRRGRLARNLHRPVEITN